MRALRAALVIAAASILTTQCGDDDALHGIGESCGSDLQCFPDLVCKDDTRRCARPGQAGATCSRSEECVTGLDCIGARCLQRGQECDLCRTNADCVPAFVCAEFNDGSLRCASGVGATQCRTVGQ